MISIKGNMFKIYDDFNVLCITTNGMITKKDKAVMGAGCAKEARDRWPGIDKHLGSLMKTYGNTVLHLGSIGKTRVFSFPVKHIWDEMADLELIEKSCKELLEVVNNCDYKKVLIPRPGCGNGKLSWKEVKPILEKYFDDRFYLISLK